ncbi:efflux transporter outer membrane subunit [Uliginosibacterium sp. H1]|uniref:efflux transporter outer membrane subunit n=1 Tax=Uliginosibacterium sp. H1 TaxID=3114757 RepID=UPI002E1825BB|nr:efflux transporter outer membrane subunit [Uliginosibacterium sp. H1]
MHPTFIKPLGIAIALALSACTTTAPLRPQVDMPAQWSDQGQQAAARAIDPGWWQNFGSGELSELVREALSNSPDIKVSIQRVRQAELAMNNAGAAQLPSVNATGGTNWRRNFPSGGGGGTDSEGTSLSLGASYEVDLWGRLAAQSDAASANFDASRFDQQTARLTLASSVANAYFQVVGLRTRIAYTRESLAIAERVMTVVDARYRNGVASSLDVARQENAVISARAALLPLEQQERQALTALALLLGRTPGTVQIGARELMPLTVPQVGAGLPAELLTRRPDLASQEASLRAADANITAARAALLPSLSLTGSAGISTGNLLSLASPAGSVGLGLGLAQSIFDGGRLRNQVSITESRRIELVENYRKAILTALKEVEDALGSVDRTARQEALQEQSRQRSARALELGLLRYKEGADDLLSVLESQRSLFQAQDSLAQLRQSRLTTAVDLYKALGGGWDGSVAPTQTQ